MLYDAVLFDLDVALSPGSLAWVMVIGVAGGAARGALQDAGAHLVVDNLGELAP